MTQEIAKIENMGGLTSYALPMAEIKAQVNLIQHVMREVMKEGEHYGKIPGCGDKATLLKPGAEKIMMTFRLSNDTDVDYVDMANGHREYRVKCTLYAPNGQRLGTGVGSCSTMEGKYRYRTGAGEVTELAVPKAYWDKKKEEPAAAAKILRETANRAGIEGDKFSTKKDDTGVWRIATFADKIEHDNPADYYNTCLKMAKKRALVDAVLTTTAASDIFTQDIEDMPEVIPANHRGQNDQVTPEPKPVAKPKPEPATQEHIDAVVAEANQRYMTDVQKKNLSEWLGRPQSATNATKTLEHLRTLPMLIDDKPEPDGATELFEEMTANKEKAQAEVVLPF